MSLVGQLTFLLGLVLVLAGVFQIYWPAALILLGLVISKIGVDLASTQKGSSQ